MRIQGTSKSRSHAGFFRMTSPFSIPNFKINVVSSSDQVCRFIEEKCADICDHMGMEVFVIDTRVKTP